jgi:hypothetical protein
LEYDDKMKRVNPHAAIARNHLKRSARQSLHTPPSQSGGLVAFPQPGVQQPVPEPIREYSVAQVAKEVRRLHNLQKHFTPGPDDTCFDLQAWYLVPAGANVTPAAGQQVVIYQNQFPQGRDFILTRYNFGIVLDERPMFQHMVLADPIEFVGALDFIITADDQLPFDMSYQASGGATYNREGLPTLTLNPEEAGTPIHGGFHVRIRGGQTLRVIFRNHNYAWGAGFPYSRRVYGCGCRLRGFYSTTDPEKEKGIET